MLVGLHWNRQLIYGISWTALCADGFRAPDYALQLDPPFDPWNWEVARAPHYRAAFSPAHWGTLFFVSLGRHALTPRGWIFLLFSKLSRAVTWSCNTDFSKSYNMVCLRPESYNMVCPRPESCDTPRALMYITPNLCSDEAEPRSIHLPDTWNKTII